MSINKRNTTRLSVGTSVREHYDLNECPMAKKKPFEPRRWSLSGLSLYLSADHQRTVGQT